jgi:hypothetical protein
MSLHDPSSVDMVVGMPNDHRVALVIFDLDPIANGQERDRLLQRKLAGYLHYIASGNFKKDHPDTNESDAVIDIVYDYPPAEQVRAIHKLRHRMRPTLAVPVNLLSFDDFCKRYGFLSSSVKAELQA